LIGDVASNVRDQLEAQVAKTEPLAAGHLSTRIDIKAHEIIERA
jgi:hypothetical protein